MQFIQKFLIEHSNPFKAEFDNKIIKTRYPILGVKMGELDKYAKILAKRGTPVYEFELLSHEEIILAGMTVGYEKTQPKEKIDSLEELFPYFDNWAVVDSIVPRLKGLESEMAYFESLLSREEEFVRRTGIIYLMKFALPYDTARVVRLLKDAINDKYYVKMAIAWSFSEAFVRDFDFMKDFIMQINDIFVRNESIQKACESLRLSSEQKSIIRELKK